MAAPLENFADALPSLADTEAPIYRHLTFFTYAYGVKLQYHVCLYTFNNAL